MSIENTSPALATQIQTQAKSGAKSLRQFVPKRTPELGVESLTGAADQADKKAKKTKKGSRFQLPKLKKSHPKPAKKPKTKAKKVNLKFKAKKSAPPPVEFRAQTTPDQTTPGQTQAVPMPVKAHAAGVQTPAGKTMLAVKKKLKVAKTNPVRTKPVKKEPIVAKSQPTPKPVPPKNTKVHQPKTAKTKTQKKTDRRKSDRRRKGNRPPPIAGNDNMSYQSLNRYLGYSYVSVFLLAGVIGGWAYFAKIQGAVIATGTVAVEGKPKVVQHLDGGIISHISVQEGDYVEKGRTVLKLDSTILNANLDTAQTNFYENKALIDRLLAEKSGQNNIVWSSTLSAQRRNGRVGIAMSGQEQLFRARRNALTGELDQLSQRIAQYSDEDRGVVTEISHTRSELNLVEGEFSKLSALLSQNLVPRSRVTQLEREKTRLVNAISKLETRRTNLGNLIKEARINIDQVQRVRNEQVLTELRQAQTNSDSFTEALKTVSKKNSHVTIQAPVSGTIHDMTVTTVGGVIAPGQEIMKIIPKRDKLIIKAQIQPQDIDQVVLGQSTNVIFSSLNQKTAPELAGVVSYISADILTDQITGFPYFTVDVDVPEDEIFKLRGQSLIAGMPADVFIQTDEISVMDYILGPLKDTLAKTMRDG